MTFFQLGIVNLAKVMAGSCQRGEASEVEILAITCLSRMVL
jgi:hypothetical protein